MATNELDTFAGLAVESPLADEYEKSKFPHSAFATTHRLPSAEAATAVPLKSSGPVQLIPELVEKFRPKLQGIVGSSARLMRIVPSAEQAIGASLGACRFCQSSASVLQDNWKRNT